MEAEDTLVLQAEPFRGEVQTKRAVICVALNMRESKLVFRHVSLFLQQALRRGIALYSLLFQLLCA